MRQRGFSPQTAAIEAEFGETALQIEEVIDELRFDRSELFRSSSRAPGAGIWQWHRTPPVYSLSRRRGRARLGEG